MVIGSPEGKHIWFSAYGRDDRFIAWRKSTPAELGYVLDNFLTGFYQKVLSRSWVRESDEAMEKAFKFSEQEEIDLFYLFGITRRRRKEEDRKWEERANQLCDTNHGNSSK